MKKTIAFILCLVLTITLLTGLFPANATKAEFLNLLPYYQNYAKRVLLPENQQNSQYRYYCDTLLVEAEQMAKSNSYTEAQYTDMTNRLENSWIIWRAQMPVSAGLTQARDNMLNALGNLNQYNKKRLNKFNSVKGYIINVCDDLKNTTFATDVEGEAALYLLSEAIRFLKKQTNSYPDAAVIEAKCKTLTTVGNHRFHVLRSTINPQGAPTVGYVNKLNAACEGAKNLKKTAAEEQQTVADIETYYAEVYEPGVFIGNYFINCARDKYYSVAGHYQDYTPASWARVSDAMNNCDDVKNAFGNDVESNRAFNNLLNAIERLEPLEKKIYDIKATANKTSVAPNSEVTLTVTAAAGADVRHALIALNYDPCLWTLTKTDKEALLEDGRISKTYITNKEITSETPLLTATFKAKSDAYKTNAVFNLVGEKFYDKRGSDIEVKFSSATVEIAAQNVRFDLNGDKTFNTSDVRQALRTAVGDGAYTLSGDFDKDGKINTTDARKMLKTLVDGKAPDLKITLDGNGSGLQQMTGAEYSVLQLPVSAYRPGYLFKGWNTSPDGQGVYAASNYVITASKTLYAVYEKFDGGTADNGKVMFGAFCSIPTRYAVEDDFRMLAESGTRFTLMDYFHDGQSNRCVKWAEKYGITLILTDHVLNSSDFSQSAILSATEPYRNSPAFGGNNLIDEPGIATIKTLQNPVLQYQKALPGYSLHINLFPIEAEILGLNFRDYLNEYRTYLSTNLHLCSDPYALRTLNGGRYTEANYYTSLRMTGALARDLNQEHWAYIQTMTGMETKERNMSDYSDYTFQTYSAMAYGVKKILFYCYDVPNYKPGAPFNAQVQAFRDSAHGYTYIWDYGKALTTEISSFADTFATYNYLDTYVVKSGNVPAYVSTEKAYSGSALKSVSSNESLLIGEFEKNGSKAVLIANASELRDVKDATVTFTLTGTKPITAWVDGVEQTLTPVNGRYQLTLRSGGGAFVLCD